MIATVTAASDISGAFTVSQALFSLEGEMATPPVFLPGELCGQRKLVGYSPWSCKESDRTEHACTGTILLALHTSFNSHFTVEEN